MTPATIDNILHLSASRMEWSSLGSRCSFVLFLRLISTSERMCTRSSQRTPLRCSFLR